MEIIEYRATVIFTVLFIITVGMIRRQISRNDSSSKRFLRFNKRYALLIIVLHTIVFGFRYIGIGGYGGRDAITYANQFLNINESIASDKQSEPLFLLFLYVLHMITDNYRILFIAVAIINATCLVCFLEVFFADKKYLWTIGMYWPIYLYFMDGFRNSIAISLCLLVYVFLSQKKNLFALILTIVACFFHYSAVIVLLFEVFVFVFNKLKKTRIPLWILFTLSALMLIFVVPQITALFLKTRYSFFAHNVSSSILGYLPYYVVGVLAFFNHRKICNRDNKLHPVYGVYFLCLIYPVCNKLGIYRIPFYFIPYLAVTAKDIFSYYENRIAKNYYSLLIYRSVVCFICIAYCILKTITIGEESGILLYKII